VVEHLHNKCEALSSNPRTIKKKKKKERKNEIGRLAVPGQPRPGSHL
jgi:hypothetical protein